MGACTFLRNGKVAPDLVSEFLGVAEQDLARIVDLGSFDTGSARAIGTPEIQRRLRDMMEILARVEANFGGAAQALAWYRTTPLDGFGGMKAAELVNNGHTKWVHGYLASIEAGIFA